MGVSPWDNVSQYDVDLWLQGQIYRVLDMFLCPAHNCFLIWHWLTIFGICVYHHERICCNHSWYLYDVDLWPQGQIYRFLPCLRVRPVTSVCFEICIPYLAHDLKVKFIDCVPPVTSVCFENEIPYLAHWSITMRKCTFMILIWCWLLTSRSNVYGLWHGFVFRPQLFCPLT